jgi:hypothetical protein
MRGFVETHNWGKSVAFWTALGYELEFSRWSTPTPPRDFRPGGAIGRATVHGAALGSVRDAAARSGQSARLRTGSDPNQRADRVNVAPDSTALRVALWRALHVQVDPPPHVLEDKVGLKLVAPDDGWLRRPDMDASSRIWLWNRLAAASAST